ncbi:hypothetical protein GGTG_07845 [Gaeumannomyces tritici R3-111a-1]|uniref:Zinc knuckle CX2CX3GHX4C domain-containing protein n=1 Tax=Gaeumannomyces tritici (strain R3-111a-1) TaxID=644352 RepID=J3P2V3_GAET3|nr:hypothetical protein GGTG_07845 [Gaeumannomyces tritici R3-111a-1]EJT73995.1 hypothetical protein GGTG_07845 [Gaeumannomyces tritici R3-111a-1]
MHFSEAPRTCPEGGMESIPLPADGETTLAELSTALERLSGTEQLSQAQILDAYCRWLYHAVGHLDQSEEKEHAAQIFAWCASLYAQNFTTGDILDSFKQFSARQTASDPCSLRRTQLAMQEIDRITSPPVKNTPPATSDTETQLPVRQPFGNGVDTPMRKLSIVGHKGSQQRKGDGKKDKQRNSSSSTSLAPKAGYVCSRCGVPGHFVHLCPTNLDPAYDKTPKSYRCHICREVGQHITSLCPRNADKSSLYQRRLRAQHQGARPASRGRTREPSPSGARDRSIPRSMPARQDWDERRDENRHRYRSKSRHRDDERHRYRSKSRYRDDVIDKYRSRSKYGDEDRHRHRSKSRYRDKSRVRSPSKGRRELSPIAYSRRYNRSRSPKRLRLEDWEQSSSMGTGSAYGSRRGSPHNTIQSSDQGWAHSRPGHSVTLRSADRTDTDSNSLRGSDGWSSRGGTQSPWTRPIEKGSHSPCLHPGRESSHTTTATDQGEAMRLALAEADRFLEALGEELLAQAAQPPSKDAGMARDDPEIGSENDSLENGAPAPDPQALGDIIPVSRCSPAVQRAMKNREITRVCLANRMSALDLWDKKHD